MRTPASAFPKRGLYAITDEGHDDPQSLVAAVKAAMAGGAAVVQYRCKSPRVRRATAPSLLEACRKLGVPLIVNDDMVLAAEIGADGVHLGQDDGTVAQARRCLGASAIVGVSCYDSVERAVEAQSQGADYVAFGRFFPSRSKPRAPCAHPETLSLARKRLRVPIVAIGGITPENAAALLTAGADLLAVIDAVFGSDDPRAAAARFQPLFMNPPGQASSRNTIAGGAPQ